MRLIILCLLFSSCGSMTGLALLTVGAGAATGYASGMASSEGIQLPPSMQRDRDPASNYLNKPTPLNRAITEDDLERDRRMNEYYKSIGQPRN